MNVLQFFLIGFIVEISFATYFYDQYPTCGDCWCISGNNGTEQCPTSQPQTTFSDEVISIFKAQETKSIYTLSCNPYSNATCETEPKQAMLDVDDAVCGHVYSQNSDLTLSCSTYNLVTFKSSIDAELAGAVISHVGSCGLCSTTADLAIYLTQDFTDAGKICATKGLLNEALGLQCYMDLGLTRDCAKIWNYDGIYDGKACGAICAGDVSSPNNGPPPACELNKCLQCDEEKAGPLFSTFAGRTRRRSGLQSEIVRDCSSIAQLTHNPCANPTCGCK